MDEKSKTFKRLGFTEWFPMRSEGETKISRMYFEKRRVSLHGLKLCRFLSGNRTNKTLIIKRLIAR